MLFYLIKTGLNWFTPIQTGLHWILKWLDIYQTDKTSACQLPIQVCENQFKPVQTGSN